MKLTMIAAAACLALSATAADKASQGGRGTVTIEKTSYKGWPNCYRMTDGHVELIATTDVGPRIIRFGRVNGPNEFKEFEDQIGQTGGDEWRIYGGHRLWHSPEARPRSYQPDNGPIEATVDGNTLRLLQPTEAGTGIQKEIAVTLMPEDSRVRVVHRLTNKGLWPVKLAPWALTVMAPGGAAFVPQPTKSHPDNLLPNRTLVLWPYTDMSDPRHVWGKDFFVVKSRDAQHPTKIGVSANDGWTAYANHGHLFVKRFQYLDGADYPDNGCSVEIYANTGMLELETLGPLSLVQPGDAVEHTEEWSLLDGPAVTDDASARQAADIIEKRENRR